jgi:hypothetical protein
MSCRPSRAHRKASYPDAHRREIPPEVLAMAAGEFDPDRRILKLVGGRRVLGLRQPDGNGSQSEERRLKAAGS